MKYAALLLALAACAPQAPVFRPVTVEIPVATPCRTVPVPKPDFALGHVAAKDGLFVQTRAALAELDQRKAYEAQLESQIQLCQ